MADDIQDNNSPVAQGVQASIAAQQNAEGNKDASADAAKKVNVPGDVTTNDETAAKQYAKEVETHAKHNEAGADFFRKYGVANKAQFIDLARSNAIVAGQIAEAYVIAQFGSDDDQPSLSAAGIIRDMQAPQENNIVGMVDRTGDVATKLHLAGESEAEPVNDNTSGTHSGTVNE